MMDVEVKRKKKKPIAVRRNDYDKNSQDVKLLIGFPVLAIKTNKKLGIYNSDSFKVIKLTPLTLRNINTNEDLAVSLDIFRDHLDINFCTTIHRVQGDTIRESYTVHEWHKMSKRMRYGKETKEEATSYKEE
jgi:hypothetical protein